MTHRPCPLCARAELIVLAELPASRFCRANSTYRSDYAAILAIEQDARFPLVACRNCEFVYAGVVPPMAFLERVYEEVIDPEIGRAESLSPGWVGHQLRMGGMFLSELEQVFGPAASLRLLDFGCGYGTLVQALSSPRIECLGYETSRRRLDYLRDRHLTACSTWEEVDRQAPYHGLILSDVLEHVPGPREVLRSCRKLLRKDGLLCVHVPNFEPQRLRKALADAAADRPFTRELNPWEHLSYFSPRSLRRLLASEGLVVREPAESVDVGIRPGQRGIRRLGNCLKSAFRLASYALGRPPSGTLLLAAEQ